MTTAAPMGIDTANNAGSSWPEDRLIVGVVGTPGAGKSTFARALRDAIGDGTTVVNEDSFLIPEPDRRDGSLRAKYDLGALEEVVAAILAGRSVGIVPFDSRSRVRAGWHVFEPGKVVVIEGVTVLYSEFVRASSHLAVYVDAPRQLRVRRQLERAAREGHYQNVPAAALIERIVGKERHEAPVIRRQLSICDFAVDSSVMDVSRAALHLARAFVGERLNAA
jgi:uridine kinase